MTDNASQQPLLRLLYLAGQGMRNYADQRLKKYDLTVEQLHVLKIMVCGPSQTQKELSVACGKSAANLTRILDRLEKKGWVERRKVENDRRASLVVLTPLGMELMSEVTDLFDTIRADLTRGIDLETQLKTTEVLSIIKGRIDAGLLDKGD